MYSVVTTLPLLGRVCLVANEQALVRLELNSTKEETLSALPLLTQAITQLTQYLTGKRQEFTVPLAPQGTAFRLRVWQELQAIPYGTTVSYGEIARRLGQANAARAVGQANHHNPLPLFIPCHRVITSQGTLGGYGGGLRIKEALLRLENAPCMQS